MQLKSKFFLLFFFLTLKAFSQSYEDPRHYTFTLWRSFLQKEGLEATVRDHIETAMQILKTTPLKDETFKVLISRTPQVHTIDQHTIAIPFTVFLEDEAPLIIAFHLACLLGSRERAWEILNIKPVTSFRALPHYEEKLKSDTSLSIDDFLTMDQLKNITLRFRILNDQEGLMVPVEKETSLIYLLEGNVAQEYPIQEIPMIRLLNQVELKLLNSLIKEIKMSEMDNERVMIIGEGLLGFLTWTLIDQKLKLIKNGWLRKPSRFLTFTVGFFAIQGVLESAIETVGAKDYLNEENFEKRSEYETIFLFLTEHLEKAKMGNFHMESFKRDFYYALKLNISLAKEIHLLDDEKEWSQNVEKRVNELCLKRASILEKDLAHIEAWLQRLKKAEQKIDSETGLTLYEIPERPIPPSEHGINYLTGGAVTIVIGELAYNKLYGLKRKLFSLRLLGGAAISALALNYVFGVTDAKPFLLEEEDKEKLEAELKILKERIPQLISDLRLLAK